MTLLINADVPWFDRTATRPFVPTCGADQPPRAGAVNSLPRT
jgi:hypothetical protein